MMEVPHSPNRSASDAKRHSRNASYQRSLPRRSTKGPLDEPDDPLSPPSPATTIPLPTSPPTITHPPSPPPNEKDLTFLLHPPLFHPLPPPLFPPATTGHRTAALLAATRLTSTTTPPPNNATVFALWHHRLTALLQLSHRDIAAREAGVFGDVGDAFWYHDYRPSEDSEGGGERGMSNIIPWDLRVLIVRLAERGVVHGLYALGREARAGVRTAGTEEKAKVWKGRLRGLGIAVAEALIEEGDLLGAVGALKGLIPPRGSGGGDDGDAEVARMLVLGYCKLGDVAAGRRVWEESSAAGGLVELESIIRVCEGNFEGAAARMLMRGDEGGDVRNNLAVTHFYRGEIGEAVRLLEELVEGEAKGEGDPGKETVFNLATCYELTGENGVRERKEQLVRRVGEKGGAALGGLSRADFKL